MILMMRLVLSSVLSAHCSSSSQPVTEKPFKFETELDDLPKDRLKGIQSLYSCLATNYYLLFVAQN